jgi:hypothetical protein
MRAFPAKLILAATEALLTHQNINPPTPLQMKQETAPFVTGDENYFDQQATTISFGGGDNTLSGNTYAQPSPTPTGAQIK